MHFLKLFKFRTALIVHIYFLQDNKDERSDEKSEERKRKRSPSPQEEAPRAPPIARPENEPNYDDTAVLLSWCKFSSVMLARKLVRNKQLTRNLKILIPTDDSDLNLVINPTNYFSASPMQGDGFNFMWAGARVSHGFDKGRVYYEARIDSEFNNIAAAAQTAHRDNSGALPADEEKIPALLRLGWSTIPTSLQLGAFKYRINFRYVKVTARTKL